MIRTEEQQAMYMAYVKRTGHDPDKFISRLKGDMLWDALDLDNTIAEEVWQFSTGIGAPIKSQHKKMQKLVEEGRKICIHTARPWVDYEGIKRWCRTYGVPAHLIICGKFNARSFIDDKAINAYKREWVK